MTRRLAGKRKSIDWSALQRLHYAFDSFLTKPVHQIINRDSVPATSYMPCNSHISCLYLACNLALEVIQRMQHMNRQLLKTPTQSASANCQTKSSEDMHTMLGFGASVQCWQDARWPWQSATCLLEALRIARIRRPLERVLCMRQDCV